MRHQAIAVIGGSGFIGSHLVNALVEMGKDVRIATRRRYNARHLTLLPIDVIDQRRLGCHHRRESARSHDDCRSAELGFHPAHQSLDHVDVAPEQAGLHRAHGIGSDHAWRFLDIDAGQFGRALK